MKSFSGGNRGFVGDNVPAVDENGNPVQGILQYVAGVPLVVRACAANATTALGANGKAGDYLDAVIIEPQSTSPGAVQMKDGSGTAIDLFKGGASSVTTLHSWRIDVGAVSENGGWSIICGDANVKAVAVGRFSS